MTTVRPWARFLVKLIALGTLLVGPLSGFGVEAALPRHPSHESQRPAMLDTFKLLAQEAAAKFFRIGCQEVTVVAIPDQQGLAHLFVRCETWQEAQPVLD